MEDGGNCSEKEIFALQVLGNSMEPEFMDGCIILIEPCNAGEVVDGMYVMAEHEGEYIFRQFVKKNDRCQLIALNKEFFPIDIPDAKIIKGIIVQRAGKRRTEAKHYEYHTEQ